MRDRLRRLILVRHGETEGESSIRYHGVTDVPLSALGRAQVLAARAHVGGRYLDRLVQGVWASTLCRSWVSAQIVAPGRAIQLESDFREIDFGHWEGLTREEIAALDPEGYREWQTHGREQERGASFQFPGGESRRDFRARVVRGLDRMRATGVESALIVVHKGVVRTILEEVAGMTLDAEEPVLGGVVHASRGPGGEWYTGRRGSDATCSEPACGHPISAAATPS